jgi:hypothetical protein
VGSVHPGAFHILVGKNQKRNKCSAWNGSGTEEIEKAKRLDVQKKKFPTWRRRGQIAAGAKSFAKGNVFDTKFKKCDNFHKLVLHTA